MRQWAPTGGGLTHVVARFKSNALFRPDTSHRPAHRSRESYRHGVRHETYAAKVGSEPFDIQAMIDRLDESGKRVDAARNELVAVCDLTSQALHESTQASWIGAAGSAREADTASGPVGLEDLSVADLVYEEVSVQVRVMNDLLRGYSGLLMTQRSLLGAVSIARGIFEASMWAAWILDAHASPALRTQRALNRTMARHTTTIANPFWASDEAIGQAEAALEAILALGEARGWPSTQPKKRSLPPYFGAKKPTATDLARSHLGDPDAGPLFWHHPSAISHGEHSADVSGWLEMNVDHNMAPSWLTGIYTQGVGLGLYAFGRDLSEYLGRTTLWPETVMLVRHLHVMAGPHDAKRRDWLPDADFLAR